MLFDGDEDAKKALSWIALKLGEGFSGRAGMGQEQQHVLQETFKQVTEVNEEVSAEGYNYSSRSRFYDDLWERFIFSYSGKWPDDQDERWEPPFQFGEWELQGARDLDFGYSPNGSLISVSIPEGGGVSKMKYRRFQNLWFGDFSQSTKGQTFYIGTARACEIDAVCSVPQMPAEMEPSEAAQRVLDRTKGRRVATSRG